MKQRFGEIIAHTEKILVAAKAADWSLVDSMQVQQQQLLQQFFTTPLTAPHRPLIASGLRLVKKRNDKIVVLCRQARHTLMENMRDVSKGKSLSKAYQAY